MGYGSWRHLLLGDDPKGIVGLMFGPDGFPETAALDGIPERLEYHPEGSVGVHMEMVMASAFELTEGLPEWRKERVRLGALVHDLGKGVTGTAPDFSYETPRHHNHEELGRGPAMSFFEREGISGPLADFCLEVVRSHLKPHMVCNKEGRPQEGFESLLKGLLLPQAEGAKKRCHGFSVRQREDCEDFLTACESDAMGRLIPESQRKYPQKAVIMSCRDKVFEVLSKAGCKSGADLDGDAIKMAVYAIRGVEREAKDPHSSKVASQSSRNSMNP